MKCNICGCEKFGDFNNRKNVMCLQCRSLERTRLLFMYLQKLDISRDTKILHFAPEKGLYDHLYGVFGENYHPADIDPSRYKYARNIKKIDLINIGEDVIQSNSYDLIIHSHVLEHIPCNIAYILFHLHRILKPTGSHICIIPFTHGKWDESFQDLSEDEKTKRFGQFDHVRRFGNQDIHATLGKIINLPDCFDAGKDFDEQSLIDANIPKNQWTGFMMATVLCLKKYDYKLLNL